MKVAQQHTTRFTTRGVLQENLRSHSGSGANDVLHGAPTGHEFQVPPDQCPALVFQRLRLPLVVVAKVSVRRCVEHVRMLAPGGNKKGNT